MRWNQNQKPGSEELDSWYQVLKHGILNVQFNGKILSGVQNYFYFQNSFYIHLGKTDEQAINLSEVGTSYFQLYEAFSMIPSFWIDLDYGGAANMCFKFSELEVQTKKIDHFEDKSFLFNEMMSQFMPTGTFKRIELAKDIYQSKIDQLVVVELKVIRQRHKWNFLQSKTSEQKINVISELNKRKFLKDQETAIEISKYL